MIWYCDSETVQLSTDNIDKVDLGQYKDYVEKRLLQSENFVKRQYKDVAKAKENNQKKDELKVIDRRIINNYYDHPNQYFAVKSPMIICGRFRELKERYMKESESRTLMVLNVLNTGVSENGREVNAKDPITFFRKITNIAKKEGVKSLTVYYHNLKFDITNIVDYFRTNEARMKELDTLIVGTKWYNFKVLFNGCHISFLDSFNITMTKLGNFGRAFGLPKELWKSEYEFDFTNIANINTMIKGDRRLDDYAMQDVRCLKAGVEAFKEHVNSDKITLASTAFADWEQTEHPPLAELTLEEQIDANYTYTGAICYCNPLYQGHTLVGDYVYIDNNGLYSAASYSTCAGFYHPYPVGTGVKGFDTPDFWNIDKYYTIRCRIDASVKPDTTIPFFRLGKQCYLGQPLSRHYKQNEYIKEFNETCYINSIDLRLLYKYYDIHDIEFDYYWEYQTKAGLFDEYIDKWISEKQAAVREHNIPKKTVAKFMSNSLTGKFGQFIDSVLTTLEYSEDDHILYHAHDQMDNDPKMIYMPVVSAILAYAREIYMDMTESYPSEHFVYGDTDSNIMTRYAFAKYVDKSKLSKTKLGYWDIEHVIVKLKPLRQKTYMFLPKRGTKGNPAQVICRCAGATDEVKKHLDFYNFELGKMIDGATQLKPRLIPGGMALIEQPFVLRQAFFS